MSELDIRAHALLEQLIELQVAFRSRSEAKAHELGLSVAQAIVAQDLAGHPGSSLHEVCARLGWPKSSVSRLVDELVQNNLATRTIPADNRRQVVLTVPPEVRARCLAGAMETYFPGAHGDLATAEFQQISSALNRLLELMKT